MIIHILKWDRENSPSSRLHTNTTYCETKTPERTIEAWNYREYGARYYQLLTENRICPECRRIYADLSAEFSEEQHRYWDFIDTEERSFLQEE